MGRARAVWAVVLGGLVAAAAGRAQDDPPKAATPPPGGQSIPSSFRSYIVADDRFPPKDPKGPADPRNRTARMHDLVIEHGLNPTVAVLARAEKKGEPTADAPAAKLAKGLDPLVAKHRGNNFGAYVIFLALDKEFPDDGRSIEDNPLKGLVRDEKAKEVADLAAGLKATRVPFGLAAADSPATAAWGVRKEDDLVVVLYHRMRVVNRWAFPAGTPPTDEQLKQIVDAADKEAGN